MKLLKREKKKMSRKKRKYSRDITSEAADVLPWRCQMLGGGPQWPLINLQRP